MKHHVLLIAASLLLGATTGALAQGTAFTYQGRLNDGPSPADGSYDLRFSLHNAVSGGSQLGGALTASATDVSNGLFTVTLDFGNQFPGAARWLEIAVRTNGGGTFETLAPRQALTATPYAITASGVTGSIDGGLITAGSVGDAKLSTNVALRSAGNIFSGTQTINGALNVNYNGTSTAAAILRARAGDEFPFAAQNVSGANLLLVRTNGATGISAGNGAPGKLLQVGGSSGVEGMIRLHSDSASGTAARTWDIGVPKDDAITSGKFYSFVIDDLGLGTDPEFMVKWGNGRVGIGTTNPAARLHVNGDILGNSTLRVDDDIFGTGRLNLNSAGFNGVTSVIRAQSGDSIPFVLQDSAGNNLLRIFTNGQANLKGSIYAGVASGSGGYETFNLNGGYPDTTATVRAGPTHNAAFRVDNASGSDMFLIYSNGQVNVRGKFYALADAEVWGEISTTAINLTSDRNAKEDFKPVNPREVLDKVARLPISEWQYKATDKRASDGSRHIGPMAQDFREAFALGRDDKHITSVDADGVALAAIQGLNQKLDEKDARIQELEESVKELKELVQRVTQSAQASGR